MAMTPLGAHRVFGVFVGRVMGRPASAPRDGAWLYLDSITKRLRFTSRAGDFPVLSESTGGGAPTTAQYLTLAADATLTVERVLTPGTGLGGTDAGAGSTYTLAISDAGLVSLMAADAGAGLAYPSAANTWATLMIAANKGIYATSGSALATYDLTAAGRALLDDATAAAQRSTLGTTAWPGFGQGRDGALAFDGVATPVGGAMLVGSTYTLVRDLAATTVTIATGVSVNTAGFKIRVSGKLQLVGTASIQYNGNAASGLTPGSAVSGGTCGGGTAGGTGRSTSAAGGAGGNQATCLGGAGGTGGAAAGGSPAGGGGGGATAAAATSGDVRDPPGLETGRLWTATAVVVPSGGAGGGGGGHDGVSGVSGGGGSGAGTIYIACDEIDNAGSITATGGAGAAATGTDNGGGGGGGGGHILLVYRATSGSGLGTVTAAGGAGGALSGAGAVGSAGSTGTVYTVQLT